MTEIKVKMEKEGIDILIEKIRNIESRLSTLETTMWVMKRRLEVIEEDT